MRKFRNTGIQIFLGISLLSVFTQVWATESGEKEFRKRCGQCHELPDPGKLTAGEWVQRLNTMAPLAGLKKKQKSDVLAYLQDHSRKAGTTASMSREKQLFEKKCTLCHSTNRVFLMPLTSESRRHIVQRMQKRAPNRISLEEAQAILDYLEKGAPGTKKPERKVVTGRPQDIFRERCSACHTLERIENALTQDRFKASGWMHIVQRMREKAPEWMTSEEAGQIAKYLNSLEPVKSGNKN